jgi:hypothetical protein
MTVAEDLYAELKPSMASLVSPLFKLSEKFLRANGNFLPHAAVLTDTGEVRLVAADPGRDQTNSVEVLPLLHAGLRASGENVIAIAVAENVTVTLDNRRPTKAIKVLFEHKRGLTIALYLPFEKKFLKGYAFGNTFSVSANPEVKAWTQNAT